MDLGQYFESRKGFGVLATADNAGVVDAAVYARPHVNGHETVSFIMDEHRSYHNIRENSHALYLFHEEPGKEKPVFAGIRLTLEKTGETDDQSAIDVLSRRTIEDRGKNRHLVAFRLVEKRPLIGNGNE
jgi:hypothetical protein